MSRSIETSSFQISPAERRLLHIDLAEEAIGLVFDDLFELTQSEGAHYVDFSPLSEKLDSVWRSLTADIIVQWETADDCSLTEAERQALSEKLALANEQFITKKGQLVLTSASSRERQAGSPFSEK